MVEIMEGVYSINLSELGGLGLECWLLNCPKKLILVDAGMRDPSIEKIGEELKSIGKNWSDIDLVLITHKHGDHTANLAKVIELTGAPIWAHEGDAADISEARGIEIISLKHKQILPYCGGIEVVNIPGHSDGNVSYYLHTKKLMIAGDTVFGDEEGTLDSPPERYCKDVNMARNELPRLLEYDFDAIMISHGKNVMSGAKRKIEALCK